MILKLSLVEAIQLARLLSLSQDHSLDGLRYRLDHKIEVAVESAEEEHLEEEYERMDNL